MAMRFAFKKKKNSFLKMKNENFLMTFSFKMKRKRSLRRRYLLSFAACVSAFIQQQKIFSRSIIQRNQRKIVTENEIKINGCAIKIRGES